MKFNGIQGSAYTVL